MTLFSVVISAPGKGSFAHKRGLNHPEAMRAFALLAYSNAISGKVEAHSTGERITYADGSAISIN